MRFLIGLFIILQLINKQKGELYIGWVTHLIKQGGKPMNEKNTVLVVKHSLAKKLLKEGYVICDLLPKKDTETNSFDYSRAVYIFEEKEGIHEAIERLK